MTVNTVRGSIAIFLILFSANAFAGGNTTNDSFSKAKKMLKEIYADHRVTIYCHAIFDGDNQVTLPEDFDTSKYTKRSASIEWEHVVPAENLGQVFTEWRDGHPDCVDNKGKSFKGRACAEKTNLEYRYMQADMYNLYPEIGSVNAMRQNYNFTLLPEAGLAFGKGCPMKISGNKVEPPEKARGVIARTYMYMESAYPKYQMSKQQRQLMTAWDKMYPVEEWECTRVKKIEVLQGNTNQILEKLCL